MPCYVVPLIPRATDGRALKKSRSKFSLTKKKNPIENATDAPFKPPQTAWYILSLKMPDATPRNACGILSLHDPVKLLPLE